VFKTDLVVKNKTDLHARPASDLVRCCQQFESEIIILVEEEKISVIGSNEVPEAVGNLGIKVEKVGKEELFRASDIVSLHMGLTPETENSIDSGLLGLMKPTAYLINTSRAGVLDKKAFLDAVQNKKIGGAALDVFWEEPLPEDDPILGLDNVTLTPHTAGNVADALPKSPLLLARTIQAFWDTGQSDMVVNFSDISLN
jgi:D-3-phosphoglycerate dehydrogenase